MILDVNEICSKINSDLATFIHNIIILIKIAVPIVLVLFGMLDLGKGVLASKEDEIKKGQSAFIKRLLAGVVVFFMISIVQLVISLIDKDSNGDFWTCANAIMNGKAGNPATDKDYYEEQIRKENPSTFQYCCESLNGKVKGDYCIGENDKRIPSEQITSCANNMQNNIRETYGDLARTCCTQFGGGYHNNKCKDTNGGSMPDEKINGCIINKIKETDVNIYKNCCEAKGGHYVANSGCVDSNGGSISDTSINSCILSQYK
ncbi:MAG: hypothetical protein ACI31V_02150 [Bacilli bacterium]